MTIRLLLTGAALMAVLSGCQQASRPRPSPAIAAACRTEVDRVYAAQNRADLSRRDERDTPFAGSYVSGVTSRQLGERFNRDNQMASCVSSAGQSGAAASMPDASTGPVFSPTVR